MGNFGIRISKDGVDVKTKLTETNKKDFVFLSDESSVKVYYAGFIASGGDYTHNLGKVPMFFMYQTDSATAPTYFSQVRLVSSSTTQITSSYSGLTYLLILNEGT